MQKDIANDTRMRYTYNESGAVTRMVTTSGAASDSGIEKSRVEYAYDASGKDGNNIKKFVFQKRYSPFRTHSLNFEEMREKMIFAKFREK